jgi:hypothetical protein
VIAISALPATTLGIAALVVLAEELALLKASSCLPDTVVAREHASSNLGRSQLRWLHQPQPEGEATMEETRAMTMRLSATQAKELETVAQVDGVPVAEAVRSAIEGHIAARRQDEEFRARLRRSLEENRDILERLAQ